MSTAIGSKATGTGKEVRLKERALEDTFSDNVRRNREGIRQYVLKKK